MKRLSKLLALSMIIVVVAFSLTACAPNKNPEKAEQKAKDAGYVTVLLQDAASLTVTELLIGASRGDLTAMLSATKSNEGGVDTVIILYFKDNASAKATWEKAKEYLEGETSDDTESDIICKRSGKIIYAGTENAIKATR